MSSTVIPSIAALRERPIPGGWKDQEFDCGNRRWRLLIPADADQFLLDLEPTLIDGPDSDVFWAQLWPPTKALGDLIQRADWPAGSEVLELGCGIGLVGMSAAARGFPVTLSDYVPMAVEVAVANAIANDLSHVTGLVLDWNAPLDRRFDVLLGSDILYDRKNHRPLVNVLEKMLKPGGVAWIGDAGRYHVSEFIDLAWEAGFDTELRNERGETILSTTSGQFQLLCLTRTDDKRPTTTGQERSCHAAS